MKPFTILLLQINCIMYAQCFLISHPKTQADVEMLNIKEKENLTSLLQVEHSPRYRSLVQLNQKYIDCQLLPESRKENEALRAAIAGKSIDVVIVSPQAAALQTCLDLFGDKDGIDIYVQPLLQPRISSAAYIPNHPEQLLKKFKKQPFSIKITEDKNWFLAFGDATNVPASSSIQNNQPHPQTYTPEYHSGVQAGSSTIGNHAEHPGVLGEAQNRCLQALRKNLEFESVLRFVERNKKFRQELFDYVRKGKKVVLISHPQVLQTLTATGWHEDGQLINSVKFGFGELRREHVWIEGVVVEAEEKNIPLCG